MGIDMNDLTWDETRELIKRGRQERVLELTGQKEHTHESPLSEFFYQGVTNTSIQYDGEAGVYYAFLDVSHNTLRFESKTRAGLKRAFEEAALDYFAAQAELHAETMREEGLKTNKSGVPFRTIKCTVSNETDWWLQHEGAAFSGDAVTGEEWYAALLLDWACAQRPDLDEVNDFLLERQRENGDGRVYSRDELEAERKDKKLCLHPLMIGRINPETGERYFEEEPHDFAEDGADGVLMDDLEAMRDGYYIMRYRGMTSQPKCSEHGIVGYVLTGNDHLLKYEAFSVQDTWAAFKKAVDGYLDGKKGD